MSVNTLTFQQSSAVLNDLVKQATGRSAVINTEADFISVAQTALTLGKDVIFNTLSNVLAKTIFAIRPYSASMRGLEKDLPQWGAYMRKFNIVASDWKDDEEISAYLTKLLNKEAFDNSGLIYGMGHAVYSVSDPRARVFRYYVEKLSEEKGLTDEFALYRKVEELAAQCIASKRRIYKGVSANVDFYSGFAYRMLGLPCELYTPIFAVARMAGWSAHRLEELINAGKIIRPAYMNVSPRREYIPIDKR